MTVSLRRKKPLRQKTPLRRKAPLEPKQPDHPTAWNSTLRPQNPERRKRRMDEGEVYGPYHRWVKSHDCVGAELPTHECRFFRSTDPTQDRSEIEGDHFRTVGAGGVDYRNDYSCCPGWHDERHDDGVETIQRRHSIDLEAVCERIGDEWDALTDEEREAWG